MLSTTRIERLLSTIHEGSGPVLSAYLPVDPETTRGDPRALVTRLRSTFARLDVPDALTDRIAAEVASGPIAARTLVVFEGPDVSERLALQSDVPVVDRTTGHFEAAYGDTPHVAPLLLAIDRSERLGVVFVDRERVRFLEAFLGEIEAVHDATSQLEPDQPHVASSSKQVRPAYTAARDDAHVDRQQEHRRTVRDRFYASQRAPLETFLDERGIDRFILLGPERSVAAFEAALPSHLAKRIAARTSSLFDADASPGAILEKLRPTLDALTRERQEELVDKIADGEQASVHGTAETLTALQRGRIATLVVPWRPGSERAVFRAKSSGWVGASERDARDHDGAGPVERVELMTVLPALAQRFGADLEFLEADARDRLGNGELAGLLRW